MYIRKNTKILNMHKLTFYTIKSYKASTKFNFALLIINVRPKCYFDPLLMNFLETTRVFSLYLQAFYLKSYFKH